MISTACVKGVDQQHTSEEECVRSGYRCDEIVKESCGREEG